MRRSLDLMWFFGLTTAIAGMYGNGAHSAPSEAEQPRQADELGPKITWDLNFEAGLGVPLSRELKLFGVARVRAGILWADLSDIATPWFMSAGVTAAYSGLGDGSVGIQAEFISLSSGLWAQLGASINTHAEPVFDASVGWSLFGIETDVLLRDGDATAALFFKFRVPIGVIAYAQRP